MKSQEFSNTPADSLWPRPFFIPAPDDGLLLFPEIARVDDMNYEQVADILKICFLFEKGNKIKYKKLVNSKVLMNIISQNFLNGFFYEFNLRDVIGRRQSGYRHPRYNKLVLSRFEVDGRFGEYFGFNGCIELLVMCIKKLEQIPSESVCFPLAISELEDFFEYAVDFVIPRYPFAPDEAGYSASQERKLHRTHLKAVIKDASFIRAFAIHGVRFHKILFDRFAPWIEPKELFEFVQQMSNLSLVIPYNSIRRVIKSLVAVGPAQAFCSHKLMAQRYKNMRQVLSSSPSLNGDSLLANVYLEMIPVLRALMMSDPIDSIFLYLNYFSQVSQLATVDNILESSILPVFNDFITDSGFILKATSNPAWAEQIIICLDSVFGWNRVAALFTSARLGLINAAEVFLKFTHLDEITAINLIRLTVNSLKQSYDVEIITLVVAYCRAIGPLHLQAQATSIDLDRLHAQTDWSYSRSILTYNRLVLGKYLLDHAATILHFFPIFRSTLAQFEGESIAFSCPYNFIDNLLPTIFQHNFRPDALDVFFSYPSAVLINLGQLLLFRVFGIPFAASRASQDCCETWEWSEFIFYLNFVLERNASICGYSAPVVQFFDPIGAELKGKDYSPAEYAAKYREAVGPISVEDLNTILELLAEQEDI